jgi:hypothetical protein
MLRPEIKDTICNTEVKHAWRYVCIRGVVFNKAQGETSDISSLLNFKWARG